MFTTFKSNINAKILMIINIIQHIDLASLFVITWGLVFYSQSGKKCLLEFFTAFEWIEEYPEALKWI